jgi:hypothetical protein
VLDNNEEAFKIIPLAPYLGRYDKIAVLSGTGRIPSFPEKGPPASVPPPVGTDLHASKAILKALDPRPSNAKKRRGKAFPEGKKFTISFPKYRIPEIGRKKGIDFQGAVAGLEASVSLVRGSLIVQNLVQAMRHLGKGTQGELEPPRHRMAPSVDRKPHERLHDLGESIVVPTADRAADRQ